MGPRGVVILQSDPQVAQSLLAALSYSSKPIEAVSSLPALRTNLRSSAPTVIVLDLEMASLSDVESLLRDFPGVSVVCNHRAPDEKLWVNAMNAGASDCCPSDDVKAISYAVSASDAERAAA